MQVQQQAVEVLGVNKSKLDGRSVLNTDAYTLMHEYVVVARAATDFARAIVLTISHSTCMTQLRVSSSFYSSCSQTQK